MNELLSSIQEVAFYILGILPIGQVLPHIWIFFVAYCGYCIIPCLVLKNRSSIMVAAYLAGLILASQISFIWNNSLYLMVFHIALLCFLIANHMIFNSFAGKFGERFLQFATILVVVDAMSLSVDAMPWVHQSIVNIIFFFMCKSTRIAGNNSLEILENRKAQPKDDASRKAMAAKYQNMLEHALVIPLRRIANS